MKSALLKILVLVVRNLVQGKLFDHIKTLVLSQVDSNKSGAEKRAAVQQGIKELQGDLADAAKVAGPMLLNLALEAAVVAVSKNK